MSVMTPISWGELFDRITILEIKSRRIEDAEKLANVNRELAELNAVAEQCGKLGDEVWGGLIDQLRAVNLKLWDIEDDIRLHERDKKFDERFIELARSVYITNDERAKLKKEISLAAGSGIIEEKSYEEYD